VAGKPAIRVSGAKEFRVAMKRMGADLKDLSAVNKAAAEVVADAARGRVPVMSGQLRGSIRAKGTRTFGSVAAGRRNIPYAGVIHFGWPRHNIEPQPFIYDALEDKSDDVVRKYDQLVEALVIKVGRDTPP